HEALAFCLRIDWAERLAPSVVRVFIPDAGGAEFAQGTRKRRQADLGPLRIGALKDRGQRHTRSEIFEHEDVGSNVAGEQSWSDVNAQLRKKLERSLLGEDLLRIGAGPVRVFSEAFHDDGLGQARRIVLEMAANDIPGREPIEA